MFLKKLYAHGFKSIGKPVEVDLMNDVNVIMGPNGSGKSNFFECIQWVLGGMSAKQLRAGSMEDVIFDGGSTAKAADFAVATLVFDNHDRELDINTDEVSITRKLTRGKGTEYFINNEPAKLKDLTNLFLNKGIGKNNYAITGQNRITEFIMMKPDDIRGVIEEAAGISGFRIKKTQLLTSISNYDRDLERINDVIAEISRSLKPLKKQIKNAETYDMLKKDLDEKKLFYFNNKLNSLSAQLNSYLNKQEELICIKEKNLLDKTSIEDFIENYNNSIEASSRKLSDLENHKNNLEKLLSELSKDKIMKENNLNNLKDKLSSMMKNIKKLEESSNTQETEKNNLFKYITDLSKNIHELKSELDSTDKSIANIKNCIFEMEQQLENSKKKSTTYVIDIEKKEKDLEVIVDRKCSLDKSLQVKNKEYDSLNDEVSKLKELININSEFILDINSRVSKFSDIDSQIKSIEQIINSSKRNESKKKKTNEVKNLLKDVKGFHDALFNIISFDNKYANAMDTLYGSSLHNFVVDDVSSAEACVSILKKHKIPPANFVIISKIKKGSKSAKDIPNVSKVSDILIYDKKYSDFISCYFSNNYIASTSEIAEKTWNDTEQKYRICTLDGTLYAANVIRGGYIQKNTKKLQEDYKQLLDLRKSLLFFNNEEVTNIYELKGKITLYTKENESLEKQISSLNDKLENINSEKFRIATDLNSMENKISDIKNEIQSLKENDISNNVFIESKSVELSDLQTNLNNLVSSRENLLLDINKKETLLSEQEKKYYIYKNNSKEQMESLKYNIDIVSNQIKLAEKSFIESNNIYQSNSNKLNELNANWMSYRKELDDRRLEKDNKSDTLNKIISDISSAENELTKISFELEKINTEISSCKESLIDIPEETELKEYDLEMSALYNDILSIEKKIKSLGFINTDAISEFKELNSRYEVMVKNKTDLEDSKKKILDVLHTIETDMSEKYINCYNCLKTDFSNIFTKLFNGGSAELIMDNPDNPLESGVTIKATPPGKKNKAISLLSGGEKSLAAVSFIFALLKYSPSPVVIFDEIDAALDEINVSLIADYIRENNNVQYVIVSHRKPMMKIAKALYGASMNNGVTELISQKL